MFNVDVLYFAKQLCLNNLGRGNGREDMAKRHTSNMRPHRGPMVSRMAPTFVRTLGTQEAKYISPNIHQKLPQLEKLVNACIALLDRSACASTCRDNLT